VASPISGLIRVAAGTAARPWVSASRHPAKEPMDRTTSGAPPVAALIGCGHGALLDQLEARNPVPRIVLFEPDVAVARAVAAAGSRPSRVAAGTLRVLAGPAYAGASELPRQFTDLHTAALFVDPDLESQRPDEVARARALLDRLRFEASANQGARTASAARYLLHTLANAPRLARESDAGALAGLFPGLPAIVVAAGPSLDRNVHDLALVRDRAVIVACDTAARPLIAAGIEPTFIVASDSSRANAGHLSSLPPSRSWLVAEGSLHPSAFVHFDRRVFAFRVSDHAPWPWLREIDLDRVRLDTWGSVATTAYSLAHALGCDPVVLAGADFAFTGERPYCRGTSFEPLWASWAGGGSDYRSIWQALIARWPEVHEVDVHGRPVRTAPHLVSFRDWLRGRAAEPAAPRLVNATGAGILSGPRIEQSLACEALRSSPVLDPRVFDDAIGRAHRSARGDTGRLLSRVDRVLAGGEPDTIAAWQAFAGQAAPMAAIHRMLESPEYLAWQLARTPAVIPS